MDPLEKLTNFKLKILVKLTLFISMKLSIINLYSTKVNVGFKECILRKVNPVKLMGFTLSGNLIIRAYLLVVRNKQEKS